MPCGRVNSLRLGYSQLRDFADNLIGRKDSMNESGYFSVPGSDRRYDRNKLLAVLLIPLAMSLLQVS